MKTYPPGFVKVFWWIITLLIISGLILLPSMLQLRFEWEVPFALPSGSHVAFAALHTLFAFATLMLLGSLIPVHIRNGLRSRRHLKSGLGLLALAIVLPLTALGIYYLSDESWSAVASATHVIIGLVIVAVLALHVIIARRAARMDHEYFHSRHHRPITELKEHQHKHQIARSADHPHSHRGRVHRK